MEASRQNYLTLQIKRRETKVPENLKDSTALKNPQFSRHPIYAYVHARDVIQIK